MKVLFVQKVIGIGGSENYFLRLLPKLKQSGIDCEFFLVRSLQDGDESISFIKKLKASGIYVHDRVSAPYNPLLVYYLYKVIVTSQAQIVHSHLIHADFWSALVKRFLNNQFFLLSTKHGYDENYVRKNGFKTKNIVKGFYYIIAKWSNNYIDYSTAVSNGLRRFYIDAGLVEANKIKTLYHGHDFPDNDFPDSVDYRLSPSQVIMVGRIIPLKGYQYVIEAISIASKRQPDVKLVILGTDYGFKHQLEELALNLKVRDRVIFVGFTKEVGQ